MFQYILLFLLIAFTIIYLLLKSTKTKKLPPGPSQFQILRHTMEIASFPYIKFMEWANIYGPVMYLSIGPQKMIVLSDTEIIKESFMNPLTAGRDITNPVLYESSQGPHGIINSDGDVWDTQRKFTVKTLREFGFEKRDLMEEKILMEVNFTITWLKNQSGIPIAGNNLFEKFVINILWNLVSGQRCDIDTAEQDPLTAVYKAKEFILALQQVTENGLYFAPWLRHIFPKKMGWTRYKNSIVAFTEHFEKAITEHKETWESSNLRDFIDHILKELEEAKDITSSFYGENGHKNALALLFDMMIAGAATTSASLSWFLLYISHYQEVQTKVHQEIDQIIGMSRSPSLNDRPRMPYTEAVVMEVLRCSTVIPLGVPHRPITDINYKGHFIPKNTPIIANLYGVHYSPKIWENPQTFRPERFLNEDCTHTIRREELMPFSEGKRKCLGDKLAKDEAFLFVTGILQVFQILFEVGSEKKENFESVKGCFVRSPKPFKIIFRPRN